MICRNNLFKEVNMHEASTLLGRVQAPGVPGTQLHVLVKSRALWGTLRVCR